MFCRKCGNQIPDDSEFCPRCGAATGENITPAGEVNSPKVEIPKAETPKAETPKAETPKAEPPKVETPPAESLEADKSDTATLATVKDKPKTPKPMLIFLLSILGVLIVICAAFYIRSFMPRDEQNAESTVVDEYPYFKYHLNDDGTGYIIDGYTGGLVFVDIPNTINNMPVVKIAEKAFFGMELAEVSFGSNMKEIGESAFEGSTVETVSFEETINDLTVVIGNRAFYDCESLSQFNFPYNGYISVGELAFRGTRSLKGLTLSHVTQMGERAFETSGIEVAAIGGNLSRAAFSDCKSLKEFTLKNENTRFAPQLFANCTSLETVYWNCNINVYNGSIPQDTFNGCSSLRQIVISGKTANCPDQIKEISKYIIFNDNAFSGCEYFKDTTKQYHEFPAADYLGKTLREIINSVYHWEYGYRDIPLLWEGNYLMFYDEVGMFSLNDYYDIDNDYYVPVKEIVFSDEDRYISSNHGKTDFIHPGMTVEEVEEILGEPDGGVFETREIDYDVDGYWITMITNWRNGNEIIEVISIQKSSD